MTAYLPMLVVVLPLLAAPLCTALRVFHFSWLIAQAATAAVFVCAVLMLMHVAGDNTLVYHQGGWEEPWGVAFMVDVFNALMAVLVSFVTMVAVFYARTSIVRELPAHRRSFFYTLILLCQTGLLGITVTHDIFNAFVFLEISSLASYGLVALARHRDAPLAAFRYLLIGSVGATFFLIGVGYLYMLTGTLNFSDLSSRLSAIESSRVALAGQVLIAVGLAMKSGVFPLHAWLPSAYAAAPSAVTGFLAATGTKVSLYLFVRLFLDVFGAERFAGLLRLDLILMSVSSVAIIYTSWQAIRTDDVKRMLAFSSVGQMGYIVLGFSLATMAGFAAGLLQLLAHALTKGGLFLAVGCVVWRMRSSGCRIADLRGMGRRMPWVAAAIMVGGFGLIGVPLTAGFVGKWHLISALIDSAQWVLLGVVLAGSLLAVVYVWRLAEAMYLSDASDVVVAPGGEDTPAIQTTTSVTPTMTPIISGAWLPLVITLFFGVYAAEWVSLALQAAQTVLSG